MSYILHQIRHNGRTIVVAYGARNDGYDNSLSHQLTRALESNYTEIEILQFGLGAGGRTQYRFGPREFIAEGRHSAMISFGWDTVLLPTIRDGIQVLEYIGTVDPGMTPRILNENPGSFSMSFEDFHTGNADQFPIGIDLLVLDPWTDREVNRMQQRRNMRHAELIQE